MSKPISINFPCLNMDNIALLEKVSSCFNSWTTADTQANAVCRALIRYDAWCKESKSLEAPADALVFFEFLLRLVDDDAVAVAHRDHLAAELVDLLHRVDRHVARPRHDHLLPLEPGLQSRGWQGAARGERAITTCLLNADPTLPEEHRPGSWPRRRSLRPSR